MNMIFENRRRSASNEPFAHEFLWLLRLVPLRENCQYSEFFWSIYSHIWTEYWEIVVISPYSAGMIRSGYRSEKLRIWTLIAQFVFWLLLLFTSQSNCQFILEQHWKSCREKREILLGVWGSINRQSIREYFLTIF